MNPRADVAQLQAMLRDKNRLLVAKDTQIANLNEALTRADSRAGMRARERELEAEISDLRGSVDKLAGELGQAQEAIAAKDKEVAHVKDVAANQEAALRQEVAALKSGTPSKHVLKAGMAAAEENLHGLRDVSEDLQQQVWEREETIQQLKDTVGRLEAAGKAAKLEHEAQAAQLAVGDLVLGASELVHDPRRHDVRALRSVGRPPAVDLVGDLRQSGGSIVVGADHHVGA